MDLKPTILFVGTIMLPLQDILFNASLILNIFYIGYQFYIFKKKNDNTKDL